MPANKTITAINTKLTLIASNPWANTTASDALGLPSAVSGFVSPLVGVPLSLEGMTSDNPFTMGNQNMVETATSMEGNLYGGYLATANNVELTIAFIAASDSLATLQSLARVMKVQRETMKFNGTMIIPSQGKTFALNNGYWLEWQSIPTHAKTLQPIPCKFRFESVDETLEA
ncbi:unnamed protein product [Commensalibacter communis]|uniref:Uncharacterized protein n=1 Tax=Commensalibacter communis TaxID=2972786 RepID=A0A9W4X7M7_9PROT|nr:hypothetical protein [Commensalibacter communis]CAI3941726.1 unnamed protein product [Commensalibacter communis]CAI3944901.1 unnamed protein product [Commensalibacter communis]CAI3959103.1 unnamed protein product [Commensalibacter communis]CAI3960961.1 unnamed protein product [Commensalibacter communis]